MDSGEHRVGVTSPFSQAAGGLSGRGQRPSKTKVWVGSFLALTVGIGVGGLAWSNLKDPLRTLPAFPIEKYLSDFESLLGASFKADFRVDADLGWQEGTGRLLVFSAIGDHFNRNRVAVLVPAEIGATTFDKNQVYRVELEDTLI